MQLTTRAAKVLAKRLPDMYIRATMKRVYSYKFRYIILSIIYRLAIFTAVGWENQYMLRRPKSGNYNY